MDISTYVSESTDQTKISDQDVLELLSEPVQKWWIDEFESYIPVNDGFFTPPQKEAIPHIANDKSTIVASPTGSGKTLSSHVVQIDNLVQRAVENELENSVYCLYISPLKSLANDIKKNLDTPLNGIYDHMPDDAQEIRHAIRHGDTTDSEKREMLEETPHILNTTPETLSILLNSPKMREKLQTVETVIIDEIHSLAANKRGVHLSVSLERLEQWVSTDSITRIGCSATVEPLSEIGKFLVGSHRGEDTYRDFEIVDTRFVRNMDLSVKTPVEDLVTTDQTVIQSEFYEMLHSEIQEHATTIIFTNTRSGAESTLGTLRQKFDAYTDDNSAVHHGSLGKEERDRVENALKNGSLDVVTTSTSLELGIDMSDVDLVAQIGSPKSIASLLQRIGRAGHQLGETVEGKLYVLDRDELVECSVMAKKADDGYIDRIFTPQNCHDVAAQHIYGMAINSVRPESEIYNILTSAYPYTETYTKSSYETVLRYLCADYDGLEDRNVYAKIWRDTNDEPDGEHYYEEYPVGEPLIGKRGKLARMIYYTNTGTIPDSFSCSVQTRDSDEWVGELDEEYLNTIEKGDVIQIGGKNYEYRYRRGSNVYVDKTTKAPTVPKWFSERLPLSYDLGRSILQFQDEIFMRMEDNTARTWLSDFPIDENTVEALYNLYEQQHSYLGNTSISTENQFVIEEHLEESKRYYYIQSVYGRKFNDGLSRLLAQHFAKEENIPVQVAVSDQGFALRMNQSGQVDIQEAIDTIHTDEIRQMLKASLDGTDFLKRYFRINATRSLMILRNYKGNTKSAKQQQVTSEMLLGFAQELDNFAVIEETYREILEEKLDYAKLVSFIENAQDMEIIQHTVDNPSPRSFNIAALASDDVIKPADKSKALEKFHEQVLDKIETDET